MSPRKAVSLLPPFREVLTGSLRDAEMVRTPSLWSSSRKQRMVTLTQRGIPKGH